MTKKVEVVAYDPHWPEHFELEAAQIKTALGRNCISIHHVGSTAVPGLPAKPKIDILATVKKPEEAIESLERIGFDFRGEYNIPMHYGFSKRGKVSVNLHVYHENNPEVELNLTFRDYLRTHPEEREEYARLKYELIEKKSSHEKTSSPFTGYNLGKNAFICKVLKSAGFQRLRLVKCTHHDEWKAAKRLRKYFFAERLDPYEWTFDHKDHTHFVLYKGVEIVGYAHMQFWPQSRAAIRILVINENDRNQGFGRQFLAGIETWLKSKGFKSIHTEASPDSVDFYKRVGYIPMPFADPEGQATDPRDTEMGKLL
jgi:GrpB-like predicted nucleotidyltransferase (UPF0157 family)/N-acetylglutamate synthase-like GNAT family acetyltransferase